jgi:nitrogen fixation protein FixH
MKTYTTWDAIGDMFVIYGIVIVVSMLVAAGHSRHRHPAVAAGGKRKR